MRKQAIVAILVLGFSLGSAFAARRAQEGQPPPRNALREQIADLYALRLTRALELTEEQTAKIYPALVRVEKEKARLQRQLGVDMRDLRGELVAPQVREDKVLGLVARIRETREAVRKQDVEVEAVLDGVLTPVQKGRFVIFTAEFMRGVREKLDRVRDIGGPVKRTP
jgi:Spy/CpxP family protein refolding chaperone